ncbi:MAG TPA: cation diffusion facilitator family transporter [Candidatus Limnocylindria bacterium]|jgi:cation diffusion facilitator family transporter|nr:cation diffusion facilitator family transporter [Candidatus Limnocylindria bacterium]
MPDSRLQRSLRATFLGMIANALLAGGKLFAGLAGNSHALVADAVESFADILGSLIVWRGLVVASKPADADHPYGHGKAEPIAAAVISTMLLLAAIGIATHSARTILEPGPGPRPFTLVVLLVVIVVKEILFRYVRREGEATGSTAVKTDAWHHRSDAITSLAAAIGITIALVGGPKHASADSVAAIVAAAIIALNGWHLLRPALEELMDATPDPLLTERIRSIAVSVAGVDAVEKCFARKMGYQVLVDMHVHVDPQMSVERSHGIAHAVKDAIRHELPHVHDVLVHIEPSRHPSG